MVGQTISHYKILEKLGEGGMGVVYKARDTKLARTVALKFLPSAFSQDPEAKSRFIAEAQATSSLQHNNICNVHDIDETSQGQMFIVMDLYEGESFKDRIAKGQLRIEEATDLSIQIAQGLQKAHEKGIVHRDIKPANVMITADGIAKILDFGLAKLAGQTRLTKPTSTVGTAAYMSPEQAQGDEVDQRTDIWSLGVVLYEALTGRLPFRGEHESSIIYSIMNEDYQPVINLRPDVPAKVVGIVDKMLQKDQASRYQSMAQVLEELSELRTKEATPLSFVQLLRQLKRPVVAAPMLIIILGLCGYIYWQIGKSNRETWSREKAIPQIEHLTAEDKWDSAFVLSKSVEKIIPTDPMFVRSRDWYSMTVTIVSDPPGARIRWRSYSDSSDNWYTLGTTPTRDIRFPKGISFLRIEKDGFEPFEGPVSAFDVSPTTFRLHPVGTSPPGMIWVAGGKYGLGLVGLQQIDSVTIADFFVDRYEVTNKQFKQFIDAGGYQKQEFWKIPFVQQGRKLTWEQAMAGFLDETGRTGPATWELGSFPEGRGDHPVAGISWYEAAAYAEFAGKQLPTVFHWNVVAGTEYSSAIVPKSNFRGVGTSTVGSYKGITRFGAYDLAGNVREWCWNQSEGKKYILGGGWNDLTYMFNDAFTQDPFDRSGTNGFRCIQYIGTDGNRDLLERPLNVSHRDFSKERPCSDDAFRYYRSLYNYDKTPLRAVIESTDSTSAYWNVQKITFNAAYANERMAAYLFLPREKRGTYQVVLFFPGSDALYTRISDPTVMPKDFDFIIRSGRAVLFPVYKSTFERQDDMNKDIPEMTNWYRDHVIMWVKDVSRSIDYLETRNDLDCSKLAYYGVSWGGAMGAIVPAVEKRFGAVVLHVAGLEPHGSLPEVDALNYVSRVKVPVLMLNGRYDHFFPVETSMMPMYNLLGTPTTQKKKFLYESGHSVPRLELIKNTLDWLDQCFGPVQ